MCEGLDNLGIKIDKALNEPRSSKERFISASDSKIKVMVIPTNEELMIARESIVVLNENK
jgi:acetate kinase